MSIEIKRLRQCDIGRKVVFTYLHGERHEGVISSWNRHYLFVRFNGTNSEACDPSMCQFITEESESEEGNDGGT